MVLNELLDQQSLSNDGSQERDIDEIAKTKTTNDETTMFLWDWDLRF